MEVGAMAARKRASTQSKLLKRAVKAGRSALRQAEKRVPLDLRKQLERTIQDGQKTIHIAIKQVHTRLDRTARQADLDRAMKRLEALSKQIRDLAVRSAGSTPARRPARRKPVTRKPAARKPAPPKPAARKAAPKRTPAKRAPRRSARTTTRTATVPGPVSDVNPARPDTGESFG
jgi:polyhydroxyalkanoate synthesis regulator phasin